METDLKAQWEELKKRFTDITVMEKQNGRWIFNGRFPVKGADGYCYAEYELQIEIKENFPGCLPSVWETEGKIKRSADWHVYADGSLCVGTTARQYYLMGEEISLLNWVDRLVIPYLANHKYKLIHGHYKNVERSHADGIYEEYDDLFSERNGHSLKDYLMLITGHGHIGRNDPCFCGSGKKYKKCFVPDPEGHRKQIPAFQILWDIENTEALKRKGNLYVAKNSP